MGLFDYFKKTETKSSIHNVDISVDESFNDLLPLILGISSGSPVNIQPREAYYLSEKNSDLGSAIDMISKSISPMKLQIKDKEGDVRTEDPTLTLLNHPGERMRKMSMFYEMTESFLLTNEIYLVARGNINREPISLVHIRPFNVSVVMNNHDGLPQTIQTQCDRDRRTYNREIIDHQIRYIDKVGLNEILPIIGTSNLSDEWRGRSKIVKLFYDVKMNIDGKRHNSSLLENGMRTSGIITPKGTTSGGAQESWAEPVVKLLEKHIRSFNQGAGNAGNSLILSRQAEFLNFMQSNVDMDFLNLLKVSREAIYNLYDIPLPMILSDAMTLSNYSVALRAYFDMAVIPVFNNIVDGIKDVLMPRFDTLQPTDEITFSEVDITGMRTILLEDMSLMKLTESVTTNETRSVGGFEPDPAGDSILVSSNKVPLEALDIGPSFEDIPMDDIDEIEPEIESEPVEA